MCETAIKVATLNMDRKWFERRALVLSEDGKGGSHLHVVWYGCVRIVQVVEVSRVLRLHHIYFILRLKM